MKKLILGMILLSATSAMAGIESEIEDAIKRFALPKTGQGDHTQNGVKVSDGEECFVALNSVKETYTTAEVFEITVGGKTMGFDIEGWDAFGEQLETVDGEQSYEMSFETPDGCIWNRLITFESTAISYEQTYQCPSAYKLKSESMRCNY